MAAQAVARKDRTRVSAPTWRYLVLTAAITLCLACVVLGAQQVEQFLIRDARFILAPPAEYGQQSPNLEIAGVQYASRWQIYRTFTPDIGRSIYLFPMEDRRKALLRVAWVKDAAILRTWPNHISVRITERRPVAFVEIKAESISRWSLIDEDGVILEPPARAPFRLPVLTGVHVQENLAMRGIRVHRMMRLMDELDQGLRGRISEVDVSDLDNVKVTMKARDHAVVLMLGDHDFRERIKKFLDHFEEIQKRIQDMTVLDLRLDDRITVVEGGRVGE
jgi:cell division protein FtsQ